MKDRERYFREAVPKLHAYLENIEREEEEYQPILKLEAELKRLQAEEEKRASYLYPDPPDTWIPSPDAPVIRTLKKPTSDRCLKCGTLEKSARPVFVQDTPFWYCSDTCSFQATEEFVPERWKGNPNDNLEYKIYCDALNERGMLLEPGARWKQYEPHYSAAYANARNVLKERLRAEARKQEAEEAEKEAEMQDRQWDKDYIAAESEHEKFLEQEAHEQGLTFKPIPDHLRIHTGIIAKTGWGKTQLLKTLILEELKKQNPPSLIVLDSTGQMVELIQQLAVFNDRLRDRILIIDPAHSHRLICSTYQRRDSRHIPASKRRTFKMRS